MSVPQEFLDEGIQPIVNGITPVPAAKHTRELARHLRDKGVAMPGGTMTYGDEVAAAIARPWADPVAMKPKFSAPDVKVYGEMTVATVSGAVLLPMLIPSMFNARPRPFQPIPEVASDGTVNVAWAATDLMAGPNCPILMQAAFTSRELLVQTATDAANHVRGIQRDLADMIGREGIEDELLLGLTRFGVDSHQLTDAIVAVSYDGSSRTTLSHAALLELLERIGEEVGSGYSTAKKRGLEQLAERLRDGVLALEGDDPQALRHMRDALVELESTVYADVLVDSGLYKALHLWKAPARMIVGFEGNGSNRTVHDAIDVIVGNRHKRGDLEWEASARSVDTRDSVVRRLFADGTIDEPTMLLVGPKFQEAAALHGKPKAPDYRAGELITLFNGSGDVASEARRLTREALRTPTARKSDRVGIIVAGILEQVKSGNRKTAETALNDILGYQPYSGINQAWTNRDIDPETLRKEAAAELKADADTLGPARLELGAKGGVALAAIGAIDRAYGKNASEVGRPYAVLNRMLAEPFGLRVLAKAIGTWRRGHRLTAVSPKTRKTKPHNAKGHKIPMDGDNLRELFPPTNGGLPPTATPDQIAEAVRKALADHVEPVWADLEAHAEVKRSGLEPTDTVQEVIEASAKIARRGAMLTEKYADTYGGDSEQVDDDAGIEEQAA